MKHSFYISCLLATLVMGGCARNPVTGKKEIVTMSEEQEIQMGKEADPQVIAQYGLYEDKELQQYIDRLGQQIVQVSHRKNIKYEFKIINAEFINAFALPGGYVYFTRGIMAYFNNEAEFAGVLGHETGHITARHSVEQQRNQLFGQLGLIAGLVIAPDLAPFAETASQGLQLLFLKFSRDAEKQADQLGVEYSSRLGYDAREMAGFFSTLERQEGDARMPEFLSTHPDPGNRKKTVAKLAADWQKQLNLTNPKSNRNTYLQKIDGIMYGQDPKEGFVENNIFYHPVLKLQFPIPQGWSYQNSPESFQMAPKDGSALMMLTLAKGQSLQDAASTAMQQYKLTVVDSKESSVNGLPALVVVADQQPQQQGGAVIRTLSYFISYGNNIYHLIGAAQADKFNNYVETFGATMKNFKQLTDQAMLNKKAKRINVVTASGATLRDALKAKNVPDNMLEETAILNGMLLTDKISSGTLIKIITQ
ncbi:MAG TPA: M48 family metalloprotease [Chitinophagaceae bacterium]|nr:M48 family metalloprotease [Chitinophagaceae bacterium]